MSSLGLACLVYATPSLKHSLSQTSFHFLSREGPVWTFQALPTDSCVPNRRKPLCCCIKVSCNLNWSFKLQCRLQLQPGALCKVSCLDPFLCDIIFLLITESVTFTWNKWQHRMMGTGTNAEIGTMSTGWVDFLSHWNSEISSCWKAKMKNKSNAGQMGICTVHCGFSWGSKTFEIL